MKAGVWDRVRLVRDMPAVASARETIPAGTLGTVVEVYSLPAEGYAVDVAIPNPQSVTTYDYDSLLLAPDDFRLVMRYVEQETASPG